MSSTGADRYGYPMEGPSIVILVEEAAKFVGQVVKRSSGNSKAIDIAGLQKQRLLELRSWGKHLLLVFERTTLKIHFMLFGSYRIDETRPGMTPRLALNFRSGRFLTYACSIRELTEPLSSLYDWRVDIMSAVWSERLIVERMAVNGENQLCDALLNQELFAGVGNIIKNEVLFRIGLHPQTKVSALTDLELKLLARETRLYSLQFYVWKKQFQLRKNWQIYRKKNCPICGRKVRLKPTGKFERRSFFCTACQKHPRSRRKSAAHARNVQKRLIAAAKQISALQKEMQLPSSGRGVEREHD